MTRYDGLTDCPWCADDPSGACTDCRVALDAEEAAERAEDARRLRGFAEEIKRGDLHRLMPVGPLDKVGEAIAVEVVDHLDPALSHPSDMGHAVDIQADHGVGAHDVEASSRKGQS